MLGNKRPQRRWLLAVLFALCTIAGAAWLAVNGALWAGVPAENPVRSYAWAVPVITLATLWYALNDYSLIEDLVVTVIAGGVCGLWLLLPDPALRMFGCLSLTAAVTALVNHRVGKWLVRRG